MNPGVPGLETVLATLCAWRHISNLIQVGALLSHDFLLLVFLRSRALDRSPVPPAEVRRGFVCALDKRQQDMVRRLRSSDRIVRQQELSHLLTVEGLLGLDGILFETLRLRVGIGVEDRPVYGPTTRPEPATAHFVRVRFL